MTDFTNSHRLLILSPYHGGSHRAWAEGYRRFSQRQVEILSLPARFWKWRMHGGAATLARRFKAGPYRPDAIIATDMLDLTTFLALCRQEVGAASVYLYLHENQLTYPLPANGGDGPMRRQHGERDLHYVFINYASMLAADRVFFNSHFHQESWFKALPNFLKHFPDFNELDSVAQLREKSAILPVGIDLQRLNQGRPERPPSSAPPLILWNQRWEYDKNPAAFFRALYAMAGEDIPFRLALCGERFRRRPAEFEEAAGRLADQIIHIGYAEEALYRKLLWEAAVTVSTADHEFFGISILEAIHCHTFPILPRRLSYPELLPDVFHYRCLYEDEVGLQQRLRWALTHPQEAAQLAGQLAPTVQRFNWPALASQYDRAFAG